MSTLFVGNAPCSWGTLEFQGIEKQPIGYARFLDELTDTGYTGTELGDWGFLPTEPNQLRRELARRRLHLTAAFVPVRLRDVDAHAHGEASALKVARLLAAVTVPEAIPDGAHLAQPVAPYLVLADDNGTDPLRTQYAGRITEDLGLSESDWQTFAQGAERIARAVRGATGLRTVFHHHCAGFVETHQEIAQLLRLTDPDLLGLVFDTGHYAYSTGNGHDIVNALHQFSDQANRGAAHRIWYVHFKDCDPDIAAMARSRGLDYFEAVRQGVFCELGKGCVNFPGALEWLREANYRGYITVEQDVLPGMGTPKESAYRNRAYLRSIGL